MQFEENLKKLEGLVRSMEAGDMKLDEMIAAFEEGRKLVETCRKGLEEIRLKIDRVTSDGGTQPVEITTNAAGERDVAL